MTAAERKVARLKKKLADAYKRLSEQIKQAQEELARSGCTHPREEQEQYNWEHDNGYGRQTMHKGTKCGLCGETDHYQSSWGRR